MGEKAKEKTGLVLKNYKRTTSFLFFLETKNSNLQEEVKQAEWILIDKQNLYLHY